MTLSLEKPKHLWAFDWLKAYWIYLLIYAFFLFVSATSARAGDDWEVAGWYNSGFVSTFLGIIRATGFFNGRIANNFFDSFFAYYDFLWVLLAPAFFTSIIYLSNRLFRNERNWLPVSVTFLMLLSISDGIRVETYSNLIGNVSYIPVIALILFYLNIVYSQNTERSIGFWQSDRLNVLTVGLLALFIGLWIENVTLGFLAGNILIALISWIKNKNIASYPLAGIVGGFLSCVILFGTSGSSLRFAGANGSNAGFLQRVANNIPVVIKMLLMDNFSVYLVFLIIVGLALATGKFRLSSRRKGVWLFFITASAVLISSWMVLVALVNNYYAIEFPVLGYVHSFLENNVFFENPTSAILLTSIILLFIFFSAALLPEKEKLLVLFSIGLVSAGSMVGSPYVGPRTFILTITMLAAITSYISSSFVLKSPDIRKGVILILIIAIGLQVDKFFLYGNYVMEVNAVREQLIEDYRTRLISGKLSQDDWLVLPAYKEGATIKSANVNMYSGHMQALKRYYHLPTDAKVIVDDGFALKAFNINQDSGNVYRFEVVPLYDVSEYTYKFYVQLRVSEDLDVYVSEETKNNVDYYTFPGPGTYLVTCFLYNKDHQMRKIIAPQLVEIKSEVGPKKCQEPCSNP